MSFFSKLINGFGGKDADDDDDDYFLDDDYSEEDDDYYDDNDESTGGRAGIFGKKSAQTDRPQTQKSGFLSRKVVPINGANGMEVSMIKPQTMDDAQEVCDYLLAGKAVVLNMEGMNTDMAQRIIDFTLGAVYSIDGDFQPISKFIFMASPRNVELSGDFSEDYFPNMLNDKVVKQQGFSGISFNG